jgi:hypothetical protein
MKTLSIVLLFIGSTMWLNAQTQSIPTAALKTLDGLTVSSSDIFDSAIATVVVFWKSGSNKCCDNLESMQTAWLENLQQNGVKMIAICTDCNGSWSHVKPMANGRNWEFEIFIDPNGDFKRAMGISAFPCTMLFDYNQKLLCRHTGFCAGDEELICEKVMYNIENAIQYTEMNEVK